MHKRGIHLLPDGEAGRAEPIVTYSRVTDVPPAAERGRIEPHFNAVRVDPTRDRLGGDPVDDIETLPLVDAPPSHVSLDPLAEATAGEIRHVRGRRGPRAALLAGAIAVLAGAGVLAFAYNGVARLDAGAPIAAEAPAGPPALVVPESIDATGRSVRVVSADQIPPFASETAALAPRAVADPAAGEAALSDQATVSGEAALSAEPPGRVIVDPPLPRLRPATASYSPPQTAAPESEAMVGVAAMDPAPVLNPAPAPGPAAPLAAAAPAGSDVDNALASVDRVLSEQRAASAGIHAPAPIGTGDDEFYGPVYPGPQPLPYPVMEPIGPVGQGYPAYPQGAVPGDPVYPADGVYAADGTYLGPAGQVYADGGYPPQPLYPGVDLAADPPPPSPWWLPKRRPVVVPNGPVPPASIPNAQGQYYGTW